MPAMQRLNISKGHAFILVFSVTSRQSLEELRPTWEIIREIKVSLLSATCRCALLVFDATLTTETATEIH